jgi:hypothetical protein
MGCDIHSIAQVRKKNYYGSASWETKECNIAGDPRVYTMFSVLAGVRGNLDNPIPQRGLPPEVQNTVNTNFNLTHDVFNKELDGLHKDFYIGEHSHSHLSLAELIDIRNILLPRAKKELVNPDREEGEAEEFELSNEAYAIASLSAYIGHLTEIKIEEEITNNDDVRLVFGFDS